MIVNKLKNIIGSFFTVQFLKFLLVGGGAAVINYLSGYYFRIYCPDFYLAYEASIVFGFTVGTVISFILNKLFTFKANDEKTIVQATKFIAAAILGIFLALLVTFVVMQLYKLLSIKFIPQKTMEEVAHIISIGVTTIFNFLVMKFFAFKKLKV